MMNSTNKRPAWFLLTRHWLSLVGVALVTTAGISWLFVLPQQLRGHVSNPYIGIVIFLVLPVLFFAGLALIPIGVYLSKRRIREGLADASFDRRAALRRIAWFFGVVTLVNIIIGTQVTYRAVICSVSRSGSSQNSQRIIERSEQGDLADTFYPRQWIDDVDGCVIA